MDAQAAARKSSMMNALIGFFLIIAVGGWIAYAATNGTSDTWGWIIVAGLGLLAAIVAGAVAGPE